MTPRTVLGELFGLVIELVFELFLGAILEALGWLFRAIGNIFGFAAKAPTVDPELRRALMVGFFALCGAGLGGLSLWLFRTLYIEAQWLRWLNLILGPVAGGLLMIGLEHIVRPSRAGAPAPASPKAGRSRGLTKEIRALPRPGNAELFFRGFLFCLAFSLVRFVWGR